MLHYPQPVRAGVFSQEDISTSTHHHPQDRIARDGTLVPSQLLDHSSHPPSTVAPPAPPPTDAHLAQLVDFVTGHRRVAVLTGAGCSTESSIPDYRSPGGAYSTGFKPMTHQKVRPHTTMDTTRNLSSFFPQFMSGPRQQARYWARSFAGWYEFANVQPNSAHLSLAAMQARGWLGSLITQNVDRLHHKAGSTDVVELHGTTHVYVGYWQMHLRKQYA